MDDEGFGAALFVVSETDEFDVEVELLRNQPDFMALLRELSKHKAVISLQDLRKELSASARRACLREIRPDAMQP